MSMLCTCIRGQMSNTFFQSGGGANVHPCQSLGGQMSLYNIFHRGADVRGGKCPTLFRQGSKCPSLPGLTRVGF